MQTPESQAASLLVTSIQVVLQNAWMGWAKEVQGFIRMVQAVTLISACSPSASLEALSQSAAVTPQKVSSSPKGTLAECF